ncbi:nuclear transcription factor Y subunit A-1-like isoform X1 [Olea europaea subsp. europaea]|uniref:Nuclear transcription factor Y subunit n=1 Tax=Olea europaea subsp. europaea TaxID=158383 RepID=A0A8S0VI37_OLEEU|nr:nuclear transcription factor Y subunit A-1-like isoform X1 [Olea europaea subsp. europaea]
MPTLVKVDDRRQETGAWNISSSTPYTQPWWRGFGNSNMPSSREQADGSTSSGTFVSQGNGDDDSKGNETNVAPHSGLNGTNGQKEQHPDTNSQMEFVSHSITLTSYPYTEPQSGGVMSYGAMGHPHLLGYHPGRIPLHLEMEEEPVFVNAKQYHGILRRRQIRAKAELEKKAVKVRKQYLHESRHQHAMRRARGSGGRFLNTKKLNDKDKNSTANELPKSDAIAPFNSTGSTRVLDMHKEHSLSNGNRNGYGLSSFHYKESSWSEQGRGHFGQDNWRSQVEQSPQRAAPSK